MLGFAPLASGALGDDGGIVNLELVASNITSQPSSVSDATLTQNHDLNVVSFSTGSPLLQTTSLTQIHTLTSVALAFGTPILGGPSITQQHDLLVTGITTNTVVVPQVTMAEDETFSAPSLETGIPVVDNTSVSQNHNVTAQNLQARTPELIKPSVSQDHNLGATSLTTSNAEVNQSGLVENYVLFATNIIIASPDVADVSVAEDETFSAPDLETGTPVISDAEISQVYVLGARGILTPLPDLGKPVDPNAIITQEIKEIEQMFGGWPRRAYEVPDGRLVQAEREIEAQFGDRVSIDRKAKSLTKFGKSANLTADTLETIWGVGGNETYVTDNVIEYISSSSALDTQTIKIECHTISGTGTDAKFTFLVQEVTLNGQNPVALPTPVARVSHAYNSNGTELVGRVTIYENTVVVGGVPSDPTKIHIDIEQGLQGALKAATTFSDGDYYVLTGGFGSVSKKQDAAVDFYLEVRRAGGVFVQQAAISATTGGPWSVDLDPAVIIPKNADVRITAEAGTSGAVVFGVFKGYIAKVIG